MIGKIDNEIIDLINKYHNNKSNIYSRLMRPGFKNIKTSDDIISKLNPEIQELDWKFKIDLENIIKSKSLQKNDLIEIKLYSRQVLGLLKFGASVHPNIKQAFAIITGIFLLIQKMDNSIIIFIAVPIALIYLALLLMSSLIHSQKLQEMAMIAESIDNIIASIMEAMPK